MIAVYGVLMTPAGWGRAGLVWGYAVAGSRSTTGSGSPPTAGSTAAPAARRPGLSSRHAAGGTAKVVTASQDMSYRQVARLMTEHRLDAVPVADGSGRLLGMVSEADALPKQERKFRPGTGLLP